MKKSLFIVCAFFIINVYSQDCNCDHNLNLSTTDFNDIKATSSTYGPKNTPYSPGDIFCVTAGNYKGLRLTGFEGTKEKPLKFINCGGKVSISDSYFPGVDIRRSKFLQFSGSGVDRINYGFYLHDAFKVGLNVSLFSTDIEVDHIEVYNVGFAGIMAKTEPYCSDPETWRRNGFILKNLNIHHNYVHKTKGEGIYIGNTNGYKVYTKMHCDGSPVFPHWLENVFVHHNIFENIGWDGIQLNQVRLNGQVYNNKVIGYGIQKSEYQDFAMSIGAGVYQIYNNYIENTEEGKGMQFISAQSGTKIFNNILINPRSFGIFIHSRHELDDVNKGYFVMNNTIVNPEKSGVQLITQIKHSFDPNLIDVLQNDVPSYFINNIILNPGNQYENFGTWKGVQENYIDFNTPETRDKMKSNIMTNVFTKQIDTIGFVDADNHNYKVLNINSSIVNKGTDLSSYGVDFDFENLRRPQGAFFDIGAYEFEEKDLITDNINVDFFKIKNAQTIQVLGLKKGQNYLQIFNIQGKNIFRKNLKEIGDFDVDIPKISSGIYIVTLINSNSILSKKIFVE